MYSTSQQRPLPIYNNKQEYNHQQNEIHEKNNNIKNFQNNIQNGHVDVEYPVYQNLTFNGNGNIINKSNQYNTHNHANDALIPTRQRLPFSSSANNQRFQFEAESFPSFQMIARREQMHQMFSDKHVLDSGRQSVPLNLMQQKFQKPSVRENK